MSTEAETRDPRWPKLLSLAVHEFRTPLTVVSGYIRMLLKERAGPISEQQRKLLEEAEKSCARLSGLVAEMSDLSALEGGTAGLNRGSLDLERLLSEAIAALPPRSDCKVTVELQVNGRTPPLDGDAVRLRTAIISLLTALTREVVDGDRLIIRLGPANGAMAADSYVRIAAPDQIETVEKAAVSTLAQFDEWRGGSGLSLAIARRIIGQHGGMLYNPPGGSKAGAVLVFPAGRTVRE